MNDTRRPRAVSGEIMAGGETPEGTVPAGGPSHPDIIDAEYEVVGAEATAAPAARAEGAAGRGASMAGLDMLRPGAGATKSRRGEPGGPLFWTTGIALVLTAFWVSGGHALLDATSFLKPGIETSALRVSSVESRIEKQGGRSLLFVDGEAVNDDAAAHVVPTLSINVLDNEGRTTRYLLGTNDSRLAPGEHFAFSSRLIAPNSGVKSVSVTFKEQGD